MSQKELQPNSFQSGPTISEKPLLIGRPFTFEEFANQPEYIDVNRDLIKRLFTHIPQRFFHVDIATGTGLIPKLLMQQSQERGYKAKIIGIDPNPTSLEIAIRTTPQSDAVDVLYLEGFGQDLKALLAGKLPSGGVDSVSIHDALHEIRDEQDKITTVQGMAGIIKPGGVFSFNSAFTAETVKTDPRGWAGWKIKAMQILGGERNRQTDTMAIHTPGIYKTMLIGAGLNIIHEDQKQVMLSKKALEAISKYPSFVKGVFEDMIGQEDISIENKSEALIQALDERKIVQLPRIWYELVAQKPLK